MKLHTWLTNHCKSAAWLAGETGLSRSYVSRLIASDVKEAERSPSIETCAKIAAATGGDVTASDFMPEPEPEPKPKRVRPSTREVSRAA